MIENHIDARGIPANITDPDRIAKRQAMKALYQEQARQLGVDR